MKLSIIVPVYNEEGTILLVLTASEEFLKDYTLITSFEIVFVDDHSDDNSKKLFHSAPVEKAGIINLTVFYILLENNRSENPSWNSLLWSSSYC